MIMEPKDYQRFGEIPMISIPIPDHLQNEMEFLRELYPWSQLIGHLICMGEELFEGNAEFAKQIKDQDIELAAYSFYASIQALYEREKTALISAGMPIGTL